VRNPGQILTIHTDGKGKRPPRVGSAFGWIDPNTGEQLVKRIDGLTYNQAAYRAFRSALRNAPVGSVIRICCSSRVLSYQFHGFWEATDETLASLLYDVHSAIQERHLHVTALRVPRKQNLAEELL
jgi:hypothetical protein